MIALTVRACVVFNVVMSAPRTSDVQLTKMLFEDAEQHEKDEEDQDVVVVDNYQQWEQAQRACRKERKVIALEITNPFSESCARVRPLFARLAKEFRSMLVRVVTGPFPIFLTLDKVSYHYQEMYI